VQLQTLKVSGLEAELAKQTAEVEALTQEKARIIKEAREKNDEMTESLFSNNEQARQLWEGKLKDMQAKADKLEG